MKFATDRQTTADLNLLGRHRLGSVQALFTRVVTAGAERVLDGMFTQPLADPAAINERSARLRHFQGRALKFPFRRESIDQMEDYLRTSAAANMASSALGLLRLKVLCSLLKDEQYQRLYAGFQAAVEILSTLDDFLSSVGLPLVEPARAVLRDRALAWVNGLRERRPLSWLALARFDRLLRGVLRGEMQLLLSLIHQLDVYIAVSDVAREREFSYAEALDAGKNELSATALWHPGVRKAVSNPLSLDGKINALFLTGANMAGKSTLMKALGVTVYLAHMGFPVPARNLRFSVLDGLYSSINLADNPDMGYSHFYAEVVRVRDVAREVASGRRLLVIFDELFKGTNVKDASDATRAVIAAFSQYRNCFFVFSTHIVEVGETLKACVNFRFSYLPTVMEGRIPRYPYILEAGISPDRQGMMIIENEGILELLDN